MEDNLTTKDTKELQLGNLPDLYTVNVVYDNIPKVYVISGKKTKK